MIISSALMCLALNIYHEARNEPVTGQVAVAQVTMNRVAHEGTDVCEVVYRHKQFSWTNGQYIFTKTADGRQIATLNPKWDKKYGNTNDKKAWSQAQWIAFSVLQGHVKDVVHGATFYHATYVKPKWRNEKVLIAQIGRHIFYRPKVVQFAFLHEPSIVDIFSKLQYNTFPLLRMG